MNIMDLSIVSIVYLEHEWQETKKCIEATDLPVIYVDRTPVGIGSLAEAINLGVSLANTKYVWIVTNITFASTVPYELCAKLIAHKADVIHPKFESDHVHIRFGDGVKKAPFVEFTAAMIDREKWIGLDENLPYWGHDLVHGYEVNKRGGTVLVDHTVSVGHVYIRNNVKHPITQERLNRRREMDGPTRDAIIKKYGAEWRSLLHCPPNKEKLIGRFYAETAKEIVSKTARTIYVDLDGVLTDGKIYVTADGESSKGFHTNDIYAIRELVANGFEVHVITASSWKGADNWVRKTGAVLHVCRDKSSVKADIAIGDSAWDIQMLQNAQIRFCPANAVAEVKKIPGIEVIESKGGEGVMLEVLRKLIGIVS